MDFETISRRESRKRRRLSERRRLFSNRLGQQQQSSAPRVSFTRGLPMDSNYVGEPTSAPSAAVATATTRSDSPTLTAGGDQQRILMKIQFHITVAPDNEPLILDQQHQEQPLGGLQPTGSSDDDNNNNNSSQQAAKICSQLSIGEQIQEKLNLSRQNSANSSQNGGSTKRRQHRLLAMHHHNSSTNTTTTTTTTICAGSSFSADTPLSDSGDDPMVAAASATAAAVQSDDNLVRGQRRNSTRLVVGGDSPSSIGVPPVRGAGRESGARSSTITGGMADEATVRFLQRTSNNHDRSQGPAQRAPGAQQQQQQRYNSAANLTTSAGVSNQIDRERIYFKRDGQRFGHEFTLKLAVDRTYRCLLKVRPLIPLQSISIQGHQLLFVDCSQQKQQQQLPTAAGCVGSGSAPSSSPGSTIAINQRLRSGSAVLSAAAVPSRHLSQPINDAYLTKHHLRTSNHHNNNTTTHSHNHNQHHQHQANHLRSHPTNNLHLHHHHQGRPGLYHAQTTGSLYRASIDQTLSSTSSKLLLAETTSLYRQQQNQMMRHFAASYCSSSNSHLGNQLIYMFDWPANPFEVNKNKNRTQVQTVLKFKNGQILSLPLQVKFYQSDCRQHLEWGSQLHFIDYDCQINQLGQISVDRIQYY